MGCRLPTTLAATPGNVDYHALLPCRHSLCPTRLGFSPSPFPGRRCYVQPRLIRIRCAAAANLAPGTPVRGTSILVVGATGTLGRQIVRRALDEGYDVRCLVRPRPYPADFLRDWGATVVNADLSKPETIPATLVGVHTIIDCATGRPEEPIKTVDWEGKVALLQCAKAMGIQKFVFFSIHNCDKHPEVPLMEIKYCTEKFIRDLGLNHVIIRLCGFMQGLIGQYAVPILEEKSVWGTDAPTRIAYMDTQDIARLTFIALRNEKVNGKLLTFAGPRAWTTQEVITLCERLAGQDANVTTVPVSILRLTRQVTRLFEWTSDVADRLAFSEITDAVVAAYILNATLVVPKLDQKSFWKDNSNFSEVFDVDWYISYLSKDVKIIKQLPTKGGKVMNPHSMRVPRKCDPRCYETRVLPVLNKKRAVQLGKFDYRLANRLDTDLQKLRCRVNYHALKFTNAIQEMGEKLIERMRMKSKHFIALHLRFEPDMLAFSGCYYGGGEKERSELGAIRKRWKTLHKKNPDKERRQGRCPMTPKEVGLMLRALGFGKDVHIYVASGEVYGGEETLAPLKALFPNFHTKDTIASKEELAPFSSFSSRMAALDFIVCDESDVFVTNNNGNMARILAGRRRYFGHKPTIRPNAKKLYRLFLTRNNMTWEEFASRIRTNQIGFMGEPNEVKPGKGEFHENPASCICENSNAKARRDLGYRVQATTSNRLVTDDDTGSDIESAEEEQDWSDAEDAESENGLQGKTLPNRTASDMGLGLFKADQPELEEMFSD